MDAAFCIEAVEEALASDIKPEIFNSDHVSQLTRLPFTKMLEKHGIAISMNGRGSAGHRLCRACGGCEV